jgi:hypothetical protein
MPLTTYTAGEVLTASSLNANFSFAAGAGAFKYITGASFTTQSTISMPASTFTSTYKTYKVELVVTAATNNFQAAVRVNVAGVSQTAATYVWSYGLFTTSGTFSGGGASPSATPYIIGGDTNGGVMGEITVFDPTNASSKTHYTSLSFGDVGGASGTYTGGAFWNGNVAHDGLTFTTSAGTITGYYRVYGLSES